MDYKKCSSYLLNEGPEIIGTISSVLENNGSVDSAMRQIASNGPKYSSQLFRKIVEDADLRIECDMENALYRTLSELPQNCSPYSMAIRMALSAANTNNKTERSKILKEATDISLNGLKDIGKSFSASLNTPCMIIFGLGIMVPMILMSIIPMMGVSGIFGSSTIDSGTLAILTLVIIPAMVLMVVSGINGRNPLKIKQSEADWQSASILLAIIPLFISFYKITDEISSSICFSVIVSSLLCLAVSSRNSRSQRKKVIIAKSLESSIFEIGNRLISGKDFETAVEQTLSSRKDCELLGRNFGNEISLNRGDVELSIRSVFGEYSEVFTKTMLNVYEVSKKDPVDAGKLAMSLGRKHEDMESLRRQIRNELKNMTDTMFGTAAFFAPLVLGLSISMLEPMKSISESIDTQGTSLILSAYLCELSAIIALLLSMIQGNNGLNNVIHRFATTAPISLTVFLIAMSVSL